MTNNVFYRNSEAGELLERFLVGAVSSLLLLRFYLHLAGYPQIGTGGLHIAHMLWGGLLMMGSIVLLLAYIGRRVQRIATLIGGIGFGIFIDELGKFITQDNNYFFRPTVAIIYATFILLFLLFRTISQSTIYTSKEYVLNALNQFEEAVLQDMDPAEKAKTLALLDHADDRDEIANQLKKLLGHVKPIATPKPGIIQRAINRLYATYDRLTHKRYTSRIIQIFFVVEAIALLLGTSFVIFNSFTDIFQEYFVMPHYETTIIIGELLSASLAAAFVAVGVKRFSQSRIQAYQLFKKAVLVQLFLTEFFLFYREQFSALPTFIFNLVVLIILTAIIRLEEHNNSRKHL